jgi:hypothetical protein
MIAHSMRLDELITKIQTVSGGDTQKKSYVVRKISIV